MRIGLVTDPNCDLPWELLEKNRVTVLPVTIKVDDRVLEDVRRPEATSSFYRREYGAKTHRAETSACTVEQIRDIFLKRVVLDFDHVFVITVLQSRSQIYAHAREASAEILRSCKEVRERAGLPGAFTMRVIDSKTLATGQGALAAEALRLIAGGQPQSEIRARVEELAEHAYGYAVPPDLFYLRARARKKGDKSVGWVGAALGSALGVKPLIRAWRGDTGAVGKMRGFDAAAEQLFAGTVALIERGALLAPQVCVSYAGDPAVIRTLPGFTALQLAARDRKIELLESAMSPATSVNLGPGSLSIGFLAQEHEFGA